MKKTLLLLFLMTLIFNHLVAQEAKETLQFDDIQFDIKSVELNKKTDTLEIELFLISLDKIPREFKLNVFATQILNDHSKSNFISSIKLDRVFIRLEDKLNYLHYLLQPDVPALMTIRVGNWSKMNSTSYNRVKMVIEDSKEVGRFNDFDIPLKSKN